MRVCHRQHAMKQEILSHIQRPRRLCCLSRLRNLSWTKVEIRGVRTIDHRSHPNARQVSSGLTLVGLARLPGIADEAQPSPEGLSRNLSARWALTIPRLCCLWLAR